MVAMRVPVGEVDDVVPDVADLTGRCQESRSDVQHPIFMKRYRQWNKPSAGDDVPIFDHDWIEDFRDDAAGTWSSR
jgi:hypothetical protein